MAQKRSKEPKEIKPPVSGFRIPKHIKKILITYSYIKDKPMAKIVTIAVMEYLEKRGVTQEMLERWECERKAEDEILARWPAPEEPEE